MNSDERYITAAHESGHAVAVMMRGGTFDSISIVPTRDRHGGIWLRSRRCDAALVSYAGPWAEARAM